MVGLKEVGDGRGDGIDFRMGFWSLRTKDPLGIDFFGDAIVILLGVGEFLEELAHGGHEVAFGGMLEPR